MPKTRRKRRSIPAASIKKSIMVVMGYWLGEGMEWK